MTQTHSQNSAASARIAAALLAFAGLLLLSAAVILMTKLAQRYAADHPVATAAAPVAPAATDPAHAPPVAPVAPAATDPAPSPAATGDATGADTDKAAPVETAPTEKPVDGAPTPAEPGTGDTGATTAAADSGPWLIHLDPVNNEPDEDGVRQIEAIRAALEANPKAGVSLVGINNFRKSSKRALLAAQSVQDRLRSLNAALGKRATPSGQQTADAEGLVVRATLTGGAK